MARRLTMTSGTRRPYEAPKSPAGVRRGGRARGRRRGCRDAAGLAAAAGCAVTYQNTSAWQSSPTSGGFNTTLAITNLGDPVSHWTLTFTLPAGQTRTDELDATFTGTTSSPPRHGWNGASAPADQRERRPAERTRRARPPAPRRRRVPATTNSRSTGSLTAAPPVARARSARPFGGRCRPDADATGLTSPTAGQTFARDDVTFAATASDPTVPSPGSALPERLDGRSVRHHLPYTFAWTNVAGRTYLGRARAVDNLGATTTTAPIWIRSTRRRPAARPRPCTSSGNQLVDRGRAAVPAARRQPVRRRVRLRAGQRHLGRPGRPGLGRRDEGLEHPRRPDPAQRGVLARPVNGHAQRRHLPAGASRST